MSAAGHGSNRDFDVYARPDVMIFEVERNIYDAFDALSAINLRYLLKKSPIVRFRSTRI